LNKDLTAYYSSRAKEYEEIYSKPERQEDLKKIAEILQEFFKGKNLLEIACGTGYWTERIAETARSIIASDISESVLEVAKSKSYPNNNVSFRKQDLFSFKPEKKFDNLFGGFIWSHIKLQELDDFILQVNSHVKNNGSIVFIDSNFIEGSNLPVTYEDESGNTYQTRKLKDDSTHLVLKNFPSEKFVYEKLYEKAYEIKFINLKYYWLIIYKNKN